MWGLRIKGAHIEGKGRRRGWPPRTRRARCRPPQLHSPPATPRSPMRRCEARPAAHHHNAWRRCEARPPLSLSALPSAARGAPAACDHAPRGRATGCRNGGAGAGRQPRALALALRWRPAWAAACVGAGPRGRRAADGDDRPGRRCARAGGGADRAERGEISSPTRDGRDERDWRDRELGGGAISDAGTRAGKAAPW